MLSKAMQSLKNSALLPIVIIVLILVGSAAAIFAIRGGSTPEEEATPTPTEEIGEPTDLPSGETSPTGTPTSTTSPTPTSAPTTNGTDPTIDATLDSKWQPSVTTQSANGKVYFIAGKQLMSGSSATDTSATEVYESSNGDVKSFLVVGSNTIYIAEGKNSSNNNSRLVKLTPSTGRVSLVYGYEAARAEVYSFLYNNSSPTKFYLAFSPVTTSLQPQVAYENNYQLEWVKAINGTQSGEKARLAGLSDDGEKIFIYVTNSSGETRVVEYTLP